MVGEYLEESYKFDTDMLIEPVRKASHIRMIAPIKTVLSPSDLQVEIYTVTDQLGFVVDMETYETKRQVQTLTAATKDVPVITGEITYTWDELQRIEDSKLPMTQRVAAAGWKLGDTEDALSLAVTSTGVKDGGNMPLLENGTAVSFDVDDFPNFTTTLGAQIGALVTAFGDIKQYPLILAWNAKAFTTANGVINGSGSTVSILQYAQEQLQLYGGPGSGNMIVPNLGCALTVGDDNNLVATVEADECVALFLVSDKHFEVYNSPIEARQDPVSQTKGLYIKLVERWCTVVHKADAIRYDLDATP